MHSEAGREGGRRRGRDIFQPVCNINRLPPKNQRENCQDSKRCIHLGKEPVERENRGPVNQAVRFIKTDERDFRVLHQSVLKMTQNLPLSPSRNST